MASPLTRRLTPYDERLASCEFSGSLGTRSGSRSTSPRQGHNDRDENDSRSIRTGATHRSDGHVVPTNLDSARTNVSTRSSGLTEDLIVTVDSPDVNTVTGDSDTDNTDTTKSTPFLSSYTRTEFVTLGVLIVARIFGGLFYSLLAPFFPTEAKKKGASETEIGLIFGCFQLIMFLMSPVYGHNIQVIGSRFMFISGIIVTSSCAILFGVLQWCPPGVVFVAMCFSVRSVEALANAAQNTAALAIASHTFKGHVSTVMGILEAAVCLGLMAGPPIGGILNTAGGFWLPFIVTGGSFMLCGFGAWLLLPPQSDERRNASGSKLKLMFLPVILITGYLVMVGQAALGFVDVSLALYLKPKFHLNSTIMGVIFLVPCVVMVILSPIYGVIGDKVQCLARPLIFIGGTIGAFAFLCVGPSPVLTKIITILPNDKLWLPIVGLGVSTFGWSSMVLAYPQFVIAAKKNGFTDNLETHGLISGVFNAYNAFGALIGPVVGGVLAQQFGFPWASTLVGGAILLSALLMFVYWLKDDVWTKFSSMCKCTRGGASTDEDANESLLDS